MVDLWRFLAADAVASRFRRSFLGVTWLIVNALAFALGAGYIWAAIFQIDAREFVPYIGLGFAVWGFISASLVEGCDSIFQSGSYTKQLPIPYSVFIIRGQIVQAFYFLLAALATLVASVVLGLDLTLMALWSFPGLFLMLWIGLATSTILAFLGARFRDLSHAIASFLQLLFVLTPIIYPASILESRGFSWVTRINPIASLLDVIRIPIIEGRMADIQDYVFLLSVGIILTLLAMIAIVGLARRTVFWI
ncbi:MAG: hypothetical protein AAF583_03820 [Pseudomonadota bacterium]